MNAAEGELSFADRSASRPASTLPHSRPAAPPPARRGDAAGDLHTGSFVIPPDAGGPNRHGSDLESRPSPPIILLSSTAVRPRTARSIRRYTGDPVNCVLL